MPSPLLPDQKLESSAVVANCRMNREREISGSNGYDREPGFHPFDFLRELRGKTQVVRCLDLCCGTGRALFQAAELIEQGGLGQIIDIVGIDLVAMFWPGKPSPCMQMLTSSVHTYEPDGHFDLITCVHGLHYLGDKLKVVERAASWLVADGLFAANLDAANLRAEDGRPLGRRIGPLFRAAGINYDRRRKLLSCQGNRDVCFPLVYLGADDNAGPNCTGQAAVHSHYARRESR